MRPHLGAWVLLCHQRGRRYGRSVGTIACGLIRAVTMLTTRLFLGIPFCLYIFLGYRWIKMGIACLPLAGESWMPTDWRLVTPAQSVTGTKPNKPLGGLTWPCLAWKDSKAGPASRPAAALHLPPRMPEVELANADEVAESRPQRLPIREKWNLETSSFQIGTVRSAPTHPRCRPSHRPSASPATRAQRLRPGSIGSLPATGRDERAEHPCTQRDQVIRG
jgi:hypothetical protein